MSSISHSTEYDLFSHLLILTNSTPFYILPGHCYLTIHISIFQYLQSDACMMESRFGAYNLQMPMVVCVVGTGKVWKMSEVRIKHAIKSTFCVNE